MGAWVVGDGHSGPEATDLVLKKFESEIDDADAGPVFWLALAAAQWKCGLLEERVKKKALQVIDKRTNLIPWDDAKSRKKREAVLAKLREQLLSPQPPAKRIAKQFRDTCDWAVGEVIAYWMLSGRLVLFRVIGLWGDESCTAPICELLDWSGTGLPSEKVIRSCPTKDD